MSRIPSPGEASIKEKEHRHQKDKHKKNQNQCVSMLTGLSTEANGRQELPRSILFPLCPAQGLEHAQRTWVND